MRAVLEVQRKQYEDVVKRKEELVAEVNSLLFSPGSGGFDALMCSLPAISAVQRRRLEETVEKQSASVRELELKLADASIDAAQKKKLEEQKAKAVKPT